MTDELESVKTRVMKLLAMTTERGASEAEAAFAMQKAQELLAQHNLSVASLRGFSAEKKDHRESEKFPGFPWARNLAGAIAKLYDVEYRCLGNDAKAEQVFIGRQSNAETARLIAEFVVRTIHRAACRHWKDTGAADSARGSYASFAQGASVRLCDKADELWREAHKEEIEERRKTQEAKSADRRAKQPNLNDLKPGTYRLRLVDRAYYVRETYELDEVETVNRMANLQSKPPKGIYIAVVRCIQGELASEHDYYYYIQDMPAAKRKAVKGIQNYEAFEAGAELGKTIGLHVQVGGTPETKKIGG